MAVRLSALCPGLPLPPERFLVLISLRGWVGPRAVIRPEGLGKLKNSNELIGNQTRDLPACSIVPQSSMLPRAPLQLYKNDISNNIYRTGYNFTPCQKLLRFCTHMIWALRRFVAGNARFVSGFFIRIWSECVNLPIKEHLKILKVSAYGKEVFLSFKNWQRIWNVCHSLDGTERNVSSLRFCIPHTPLCSLLHVEIYLWETLSSLDILGCIDS
jgi:hypothetical protein